MKKRIEQTWTKVGIIWNKNKRRLTITNKVCSVYERLKSNKQKKVKSELLFVPRLDSNFLEQHIDQPHEKRSLDSKYQIVHQSV